MSLSDIVVLPEPAVLLPADGLDDVPDFSAADDGAVVDVPVEGAPCLADGVCGAADGDCVVLV
jgi:hypothetical protein